MLSKLCTIVDDPFECTLSRIPEYAFDSLNAAMFATKSLTPFEVLSSLNTGGASSCAAISCRKSMEKGNNVLNMKLMNLLRSTPSLFSKTSGYSEMKRRDKEGVIFMRGIMDEFTHLKNFSIPVDTSLVISICAQSDAYVPRQGCSKLEDLWPGTTVRYLDSGHVGAYLWHRKVFRSAIIEAFERAKAVCPPPRKFSL